MRSPATIRRHRKTARRARRLHQFWFALEMWADLSDLQFHEFQQAAGRGDIHPRHLRRARKAARA